MGERDGSIVLCQGIPVGCTTVSVTTLDELEAALESVPEDVAPGLPAEVTGDIVLGGEVGGFKRPGFRRNGTGENTFGNPRVYHGQLPRLPGRPLPRLHHQRRATDRGVSIDWWTIAFDELPGGYFEDMLASFQFLD